MAAGSLNNETWGTIYHRQTFCDKNHSILCTAGGVLLCPMVWNAAQKKESGRGGVPVTNENAGRKTQSESTKQIQNMDGNKKTAWICNGNHSSYEDPFYQRRKRI